MRSSVSCSSLPARTSSWPPTSRPCCKQKRQDIFSSALHPERKGSPGVFCHFLHFSIEILSISTIDDIYIYIMVIDKIHRVSTLFCCFMEVKPMAGKLCPNCKQFTFFKTVGENRECTKCGYRMVVPIQSKGRGERCPNCGKLTVQNQGGRKCCTNCGATFKGGKNG